jgi:hypothetical protein
MKLVRLRPDAWQRRARCTQAGLDLFFPEGADTRRAKACCAGCPVWAECLEFGLDEDDGVWAGLNRAERTRLRRLQHRIAMAPDHEANVTDIRRLLAGGLAAERLAALVGRTPEQVVSMSRQAVTPRRHPRVELSADQAEVHDFRRAAGGAL